MIHTQPVFPRLYRATGVAAPTAQYAGHCRATCPRCNSGVVRIRRRYIDRLVNIVHPVRRYRCGSCLCSWEGNLANDAAPSMGKQFGAGQRARGETLKGLPLRSDAAE